MSLMHSFPTFIHMWRIYCLVVAKNKGIKQKPRHGQGFHRGGFPATAGEKSTPEM